jgi:polysaccharide biosynthesis/export protein
MLAQILASEYLCGLLSAVKMQGKSAMNKSNFVAFVTSVIVFTISGSAGAQQAPATYAVKPGDLLIVNVWKEPDLQGPVLVRPDGKFTIPLVGEVDANGRSVSDLQKTVTERLTKYIADPVVTVSVQEVRGNKVYVIGQVTKPGEFVVNPQVDVMQALSMAGGGTPFAQLNDVKILRRTGAVQQALRFDYTEVLKGRRLEQNIILQAGDVVVVP